MNCRTWQQKILLSESGELPASETSELSKHLTTCADCRAFADDSRIIQGATRQTHPNQMTPAATLQTIREAAGKRTGGKGIRLPWPSPSFWAACAATLMITASAWWLIARQQPHSSSSTLDHLHALAAGLSSQTIETDSQEGTTVASEEERLRRLGQQLLYMEGFTAEEAMDASIEPEPLSPTALLPHRTHALPRRRCG